MRAPLLSLPVHTQKSKDNAACSEILSVFVSKLHGERFSWEQARDMTFGDIAKNIPMYHAMLSRLFREGAEDTESAAHAEVVELLALKVSTGFYCLLLVRCILTVEMRSQCTCRHTMLRCWASEPCMRSTLQSLRTASCHEVSAHVCYRKPVSYKYGRSGLR